MNERKKLSLKCKNNKLDSPTECNLNNLMQLHPLQRWSALFLLRIVQQSIVGKLVENSERSALCNNITLRIEF
jgi:hypothetical protein